MPRLFFTSYAHNNRDEHLERFVRELAKEVLPLLAGGQLDDVSFYDADQIETGDYWRLKLAAELSHSRVCVAVCTPAFLASRFCGKELWVFLDRMKKWQMQAAAANVTKSPVFPILWVKVPKLPDVLAKDFQKHQGTFPKEYAEKGLRTMYALAKYAQKRKEIVLTLASLIVEAADAVDLPIIPALPHFDQISSALHDDEQPIRHGVGLVPVVADGMHRELFPGGQSLAVHMQTACGMVPWRVIAQDATLTSRLHGSLAAREIALVVTDLQAIQDPLFQNTLASIDAGLAPPAAIVVVRRENDAPDPAQEQNAAITVQTRFAKAIAQGVPVDWTSVRTAPALQTHLAQTILGLRKSLLIELVPAEAKDPALLAAAIAEGVPIQHHPTLAGPGEKVP
jgi:hypothetical protein